MKLNWKQQEWLKWYEGGLKDGYLMYAQDEYSDPVETPIRDIPVEPWYYQYKKELYETPAPTVIATDSTMNDAMKSFLVAKHEPVARVLEEIDEEFDKYGGVVMKDNKVVPMQSFLSNPAAILGALGGKKRAEKLSKERRSEIARMGGLAKGKSK